MADRIGGIDIISLIHDTAFADGRGQFLWCRSLSCYFFKNGWEDLDQVSGGGSGLTDTQINKIRDNDIYSLSNEEKKYIYYRLRVLRNSQGKSLEECKDICSREFHRFGIRPAVEEFVEIWYPKNVRSEDIELYLKLYDSFGEGLFS